jgi:hypothetical protein
MKLFYSPEYVLAQHSFDTTRKAQWVADSLQDLPIPGVEIATPEPLTEADICAVHNPAYVAAVRTGSSRELAESQGFPWDPALWQMVLVTNGGAVAAALAALTEGRAGSLSSDFTTHGATAALVSAPSMGWPLPPVPVWLRAHAPSSSWISMPTVAEAPTHWWKATRASGSSTSPWIRSTPTHRPTSICASWSVAQTSTFQQLPGDW